MRLNIITIITIIGSILLFFAFSLNNNFPRSYHHAFTKTTDLSKENINGIFLNNDFYSQEITQEYGKKTEQSRNVTDYDYYELNRGIEVAVNKTGKISRFIITDSNLKTAKGIKIGNEKKDIIKEYGENYYFRTEQGANIIGYLDKKRKISLEFWLFDGKVNLYKLDNKSMK
ncbi:hypothetical protein OR571_03640 [Psychrobacillus sp. NEAU-3TGS]|uniref:hypothetical protein n=1 Tax=Psychrobacillus sp. NEAU-3TGS TaxID=2995412 RepID=UPI0024969DE4|nr:hypothetical protein [Psychrobacillus sp. NEAU-3TGS]MDI2586243.1 hypothetical protein [Psychrobacillus sp. NEAU-3TGS]